MNEKRDGRMDKGVRGWMGGWTEGRRGLERSPLLPFPHLDVIIEFPEGFVSQNLAYRRLGHPRQPCSTTNRVGIPPPVHLGRVSQL